MAAFGHRIRSLTIDPDAKTLQLVWDDDSVSVKAMAPLIAGRRLFKPLADAALFTQARLINDGRGVAWGDEVDICADALWLEAHPQDDRQADHSDAAE